MRDPKAIPLANISSHFFREDKKQAHTPRCCMYLHNNNFPLQLSKKYRGGL